MKVEKIDLTVSESKIIVFTLLDDNHTNHLLESRAAT